MHSLVNMGSMYKSGLLTETDCSSFFVERALQIFAAFFSVCLQLLGENPHNPKLSGCRDKFPSHAWELALTRMRRASKNVWD